MRCGVQGEGGGAADGSSAFRVSRRVRLLSWREHHDGMHYAASSCVGESNNVTAAWKIRAGIPMVRFAGTTVRCTRVGRKRSRTMRRSRSRRSVPPLPRRRARWTLLSESGDQRGGMEKKWWDTDLGHWSARAVPTVVIHSYWYGTGGT